MKKKINIKVPLALTMASVSLLGLGLGSTQIIKENNVNLNKIEQTSKVQEINEFEITTEYETLN